MAVIPDFPVFSFRANWREPITERVSFLTDVLRASQGAEQRRSLRETPRRSYEADFLLTGNERTFWDLFINKLGGGQMYTPIPWEVATATNNLISGFTERVNFDTTFREWPYLEGEYALLIGKTALTCEVVQIASVDASGIDLTEPVSRPWPMGSKIVPLKLAVIEQSGDPSHKTAGVATVTAQFRFTGANPWTPAEDDSPLYGGLPVFLSEPNWVEDLSVQMTRELAIFDSGIGRTYQVDKLGRVLLGQAHRWYLPGRERLAAFRDLIYRHRGRSGAFWLPTFKADFRLATSAGSGATQITVENVGFQYTGGPTSGREYIAIKHDGGLILRKIITAIPGTTAATERLNLDAPLGLALSPGQVRRISFLDTARFDTDDFEIVHYGGADAHHDVSAMFRAFKNTRSSPEPISYPIPGGAMGEEPCGISFTLLNPGFESGTYGWSVYAGGFSAVTSYDQGAGGVRLPYDGLYFAACSDVAFVSFGQELDILPDWIEGVDAGDATLNNVTAYHNAGVPLGSVNDQGRLFVSFINGAGTITSSVYSAWDTTFGWAQLSIPSTAVPPGTRRIRVGTENIPEDAVNDNLWDLFTQPTITFS